MNEYNAGDLVEAVNGDTVIRGRLHGRGNRPIFMVAGAVRFDPLHLKSNGFTVTVIERAAPPLPTESGFYRVSGSNAAIGGTVRRTDDGRWWWIGNDFCTAPEEQAAWEIAQMMPLTCLEPVADTAKKVLDRVREEYDHGPFMSVASVLPRVAKEFGVTS